MHRQSNCQVRYADVSKSPVTATACLTDLQYTQGIYVRHVCASAKPTAPSHALRMSITRPISRLELPLKVQLVQHLDLLRGLHIYPFQQQPW
jgi:hypothetical protein